MAFLGELEQVMAFNRMYQSLHNIGELCCLLAIESFGINVAVRYVCELLLDTEKFRTDLIEIVKNIYKKDEQNPKYRLILEKNLAFISLTYKNMIIIFFIVCLVVNFAAWIASLLTGEFILVAPIYMPWVDPQTLSAYIISSAILFFFTFWIYLVFLPAESFIFVSTLQTIPLIDVYCMKIQDFGDELMKSKIQKPKIEKVEQSTSKEAKVETVKAESELRPEADIEKKLINLIKEFNEYDDFLKNFIKSIEIQTFVVLSINATAIGMAVLTSLYYSKIIGAILVGFFSFQVFIPCSQGTIISNQKQKLLTALWEFPWYELSLKNQKVFLQFLHLCQNSKEFRIFIVGEINMELFTDIMNAAYSSVLFFKDFFNKI
ncbi:hypothetical protein PVAND_006234 [Polypedilum vanderplanki]|uniref:Odorant receptor n=1 Tax=Polypedilum vanderplanki TaxID=319348 RepID=A0A9J6C307_POLVA|nr:hypothetical protein PVAND_006234 [Polypedilum vanderplanki]